jgi:hypothetical protein
MIYAFVALSLSQLISLSFLSLHPKNEVLTFGFEPGGTFDLRIESPAPRGALRGLFVTESELYRLDSRRLSEFCFSSDFRIADLNFSSSSGVSPIVWSGVVTERSVYTLFFWQCDSPRTNFTLTARFANPTTRIDTRDMVLPRFYRVFSVVYAVLGVVWTINGLVFFNFRVPLHTLFLLLPVVRSYSLHTSRSFWLNAEGSDEPFRSQVLTISLLEFAFYTMTLAGVAFACAGFCIYRQKFYWRDRLEIVLSSALVTGSILSVEFIANIQQAFVVLGLICFSVIWFMKQGVISIVMVTTLMKQMESEPQVIAKVKLSRNFVVASCLTMLGTLTIGSVAAGLEFRKSICALIVELGMLVNTALQLKYFLLRKTYYGCAADEGPKRRTRKPVVLTDPVRSELAVLSL